MLPANHFLGPSFVFYTILAQNHPLENFMQYPPLSLTLMLAFTCCALGLVLGILILGFVLSFQNRKKDKEEKKDK
jgi:hypothetical protein